MTLWVQLTPDDVWGHMGRPTPVSAAQARRIQSLINEALFLIGRRVTAPDQETLTYVVRKAVVAACGSMDPDVSETTVSVDDTTVTKRRDTGPASWSVEITDDLWEMLEARPLPAAYSIRPTYQPG